MSNTVWLSQAKSVAYTETYAMKVSFPEIFDTRQLYFLEDKKKQKKISKTENEELSELKKVTQNFIQGWHKGEYIEPKHMPSKVYKKPNSNIPKNEAIFAVTGGLLLVNEKCFEIISKHKLGKTHFSQVYIYDIETEEQLSDIPYYFINLAETKNFLNVEESQSIEGNEYSPHLPIQYLASPQNDDIILNNETNKCDVDLWHDPILHDSLFLSDKLVNALLEAGITKKDLGLVSCKIK